MRQVVVDAGEGCCIGREGGGEGKMRGDGGEEGDVGVEGGFCGGGGVRGRGGWMGVLNGVLFERCD